MDEIKAISYPKWARQEDYYLAKSRRIPLEGPSGVTREIALGGAI